MAVSLSGYAPVVDILPAGNAYPTTHSDTLGERAGMLGMTNSAVDSPDPSTNGAAAAAPRSGLLIGFLTFAVLLFGLMFVAKKTGEGDEFKNVKASLYNVVVIGLAAIVAIPVFKMITGRFQIPGVSAWVAQA